MADVDPKELLAELGSLVEELKVVSYRWLARHFNVPANLSKRVLAQYAEQHKGRVKTTYLVSGWLKEGLQHVVKVVDGQHIDDCRAQLDPISAMHVYSVAPLQHLDALSLWQEDHLQSQELIKGSLEGRDSASIAAFKQNSCSSVRFSAPPRASRPAPVVHADAEPAPRSVPAPKPKAPQGAGNFFQAKGPAAAPAAPAVAAPPEAAAAPAPAAAAAPKKPDPSVKANPLTSMWGKAAAKKPSAPAAASKAAEEAPNSPSAAAAAAAASAAAVPTHLPGAEDSPAVVGKRNKRVVHLADSDDEEQPEPKAARQEEARARAAEPAAAPPPTEGVRGGKPAAAAPAAGGDPEDGKEAAKGKRKKSEAAGLKPAKRGKGSKGSASVSEPIDLESAEVEPGEGAEEEDAPAPAAPQPARPPSVFSKPAAEAEAPPGGRRHKELRTTINDDGEEVTEEVWVDGERPSRPVPVAAAPAPAPKAAPAPARPSGGKSEVGTGKGSGGGGGKGKAAPAGQKSIASFFSKKA